VHVLTQNHSALRTRSLRLLQLLEQCHCQCHFTRPGHGHSLSQTHSQTRVGIHTQTMARCSPKTQVEEPDSQAGRALGSNSSSSSSLLPAKRSCDPLPNVRDRLRLCLVIFIYFFRWATYPREIRQVDYRGAVGKYPGMHHRDRHLHRGTHKS